jgi:hypothetical protein
VFHDSVMKGLTGALFTSAWANAEVLLPRVARSCLANLEIPPIGIASKAGFFAAIPSSADLIVGSKPCTDWIIDCASEGDTPVVFCES